LIDLIAQVWADGADGNERGRNRESPSWEIRFYSTRYYRRLRGKAEAVWLGGRRTFPWPTRLRHCAPEKLAVSPTFLLGTSGHVTSALYPDATSDIF